MNTLPDEIEFFEPLEGCPRCFFIMTKLDKLDWMGSKQWSCETCEQIFVRSGRFWFGKPINNKGKKP